MTQFIHNINLEWNHSPRICTSLHVCTTHRRQRAATILGSAWGPMQQIPGIQPVTLSNPAQVMYTAMWLSSVWGIGRSRCCAMLAVLTPSSCYLGIGRCAHQLSERIHASGPCISTTHKTLEINKIVVLEPCKRRRRYPVGL
jgi:hypothetical protein